MVSGYFSNAARLRGDGVYVTVKDRRPVALHPTCLFARYGTPPPWIVYHEVQLTTEEFVRDVSAVNPH